jgi:pyruvate,water dikinase
MTRVFAPRGIRLPAGFAVTATAYWTFVDANGLRPVIERALARMRSGERSGDEASREIRDAFRAAEIPPALSQSIGDAYVELGRRLRREDLLVAVRSSATAEDLPSASFAGQQESYLGIRGNEGVVDAESHRVSR